MQVDVYERADETLMVARVHAIERVLPRSCGPVHPLGRSEIDEHAISPWVAERLRSVGHCAVSGDDALLVTLGMPRSTREATTTLQ